MSLDGTYGGLKASVADFLNRQDLTAVIPDFVTIATAALTRRLIKDGPVREMFGTWAPTISTEFTNLPADFKGVKSFYIPTSSQPRVEFAEPEKIAEMKIMFPSESSDPRLYSIVGSQLQLWPFATGGSFVGSIGYWQAIPAFTNDASTNWLLTAHPDLYLYTSLIQSAPYLKDDARLQVWGELAVTGVQDLIDADKIGRLAPQISAPIQAYEPP